MMCIRQNVIKLSPSVVNLLRYSSSDSSKPDDIAWSTGEKQKPSVWRHHPHKQFKIPDHLFYPHKLDPKDPEQKYPYKLPCGGIKYFNFTYYPRYPDEKEPPVEPTPLFLVYRTRTTRFRPYWEKKIIKRLGLDGGTKHTTKTHGYAAICKNIPEVNAMLWRVKHLVKIVPLKFPENIPKDANPLHCFIKENGEVVYNPSVKVTEEDLEPLKPSLYVDRKWIDEHTRKIYRDSLDLEF